jgi:hypothetical protein
LLTTAPLWVFAYASFHDWPMASPRTIVALAFCSIAGMVWLCDDLRDLLRDAR